MPDARTHDILTLISGAILVPFTYTVMIARDTLTDQALTSTGIFFVAHMLSGLMFSPDLDLDGSIDDRWWIFGYLWRPYMWVVPHRNFWSHGLILPPLLRLLYFYIVLVGLIFGGSWVLSLMSIVVPNYPMQLTQYMLTLSQRYPRETMAVLVGFVTGGAVHSIADWLVTGGKHYLHKVGIHISTD